MGLVSKFAHVLGRRYLSEKCIRNIYDVRRHYLLRGIIADQNVQNAAIIDQRYVRVCDEFETSSRGDTREYNTHI